MLLDPVQTPEVRATLEQVANRLSTIGAEVEQVLKDAKWDFDALGRGITRWQLLRARVQSFLNSPGVRVRSSGIHVRLVIPDIHFVVASVHVSSCLEREPKNAMTWESKGWLWPSKGDDGQGDLFVPETEGDAWGTSVRPFALCWAGDMIFVGIPDKVTAKYAAQGFTEHVMLWRDVDAVVEDDDFDGILDVIDMVGGAANNDTLVVAPEEAAREPVVPKIVLPEAARQPAPEEEVRTPTVPAVKVPGLTSGLRNSAK